MFSDLGLGMDKQFEPIFGSNIPRQEIIDKSGVGDSVHESRDPPQVVCRMPTRDVALHSDAKMKNHIPPNGQL